MKTTFLIIVTFSLIINSILASPPIKILVTLSPMVDSTRFVLNNKLDVYFSEPVETISAENVQHYFIDHDIGFPVYALKDLVNTKLVHLTFIDSFPIRTHMNLIVSGVKDISGNQMLEQSIVLLMYQPEPFDILIDEIMADPSPSVAMPEVEWIEIRNVSSFPINLYGWRIAKISARSGPMPNFILQPDSLVLICSTGSLAELIPFGTVKSVTNFPSLINSADRIFILSPSGKIIHTVEYSDDWYNNELKKQGGWSLEMTDINNPCEGAENWSASVSVSGATPSKINSVDAVNSDETQPRLLSAYVPDSLHVLLTFSESLDSSIAVQCGHYQISQGIGTPIAAAVMAPTFNKVLLTTVVPFQPHFIYTVSAVGVMDCVHNEVLSFNTARFAIQDTADSLDLVINELLFNPKPNGVDYLEIYNRSNKVINLKKTYMANRNTMGAIDNIAAISDEDLLIFPQDFMVISPDVSITKRDYFTPKPESFVQNENLPSMNDDEGEMILLNDKGNILDEVKYSKDWHFELINNDEGISLERIDATMRSDEKNNWHSAAESAGYGTPGYKNSQSALSMAADAALEISPKVISPDNDGIDDYLTVKFNFPEPGNVVNMMLYDISGKLICWVANNLFCGTSGRYYWDGLGKNKERLLSGAYILYSEVFNAKGKLRKFKNVVVIR